MLVVKKPITNGSIVTIKLITGDEFLCKLITMDSTQITVSKPLGLQMTPQQTPKGIVQVPAFVPFMAYADPDEQIQLDRNHVLIMARPVEELEKAYTATTSNVIMPAGPGFDINV